MSKYSDRAAELREDPNVHYNCAQAVFIPFAEEAGLTMEQADAITANFGSGMRIGSVCGAITGGLMALGLLGISDSSAITEYWKHFAGTHHTVDCRDLLAANAKTGRPKKEHCDGMVYEAVGVVEKILEERKNS